MEKRNTRKSVHEVDDLCVSHETWEKLLGSQKWEGLLEPLELNLRKFILRCGNFCQAAYDVFAGPTVEGVRPPDASRYDVHSSFYATTCLTLLERILHVPARLDPQPEGSHVPNWMGYCAATTDEASRAAGRREIYVAWRGTKRLFEWRNNLMFHCTNARSLLSHVNGRSEKNKPKVMKGWLSIYTSTASSEVKRSARDQVRAEIGRLVEKHRGEKISILLTGHSLGGILAILSAFDLVENGVGEDIRVAAVAFGCPQVGNKAFKERVEQHRNLSILHVRNEKDFIPRFPLGRYASVGKELVIDTAKSPISIISQSLNFGVFHDLEAVLHMVSGWNGPDKAFVMRVYRNTDRLFESTKSF